MIDPTLSRPLIEKTIIGRIVRAVIALIIGVALGAAHYLIYLYPLLTLLVVKPSASTPQWILTVTENGLQLLYFAFPLISPIVGVLLGAFYRFKVYLLVAVLLFILPIPLVVLWLNIIEWIT